MKKKYCEKCKPGFIVVRNNIPKNMHDYFPDNPIELKPAPCVCKKKLDDCVDNHRV